MYYLILSSKRPWVLEVDGPKIGEGGGGAYTDKPFVCISHIYVNHRIIKMGRWVLTRRWART